MASSPANLPPRGLAARHTHRDTPRRYTAISRDRSIASDEREKREKTVTHRDVPRGHVTAENDDKLRHRLTLCAHAHIPYSSSCFGARTLQLYSFPGSKQQFLRGVDQKILQKLIFSRERGRERERERWIGIAVSRQTPRSSCSSGWRTWRRSARRRQSNLPRQALGGGGARCTGGRGTEVAKGGVAGVLIGAHLVTKQCLLSC